jgi:hypothetical protein
VIDFRIKKAETIQPFIFIIPEISFCVLMNFQIYPIVEKSDSVKDSWIVIEILASVF